MMGIERQTGRTGRDQVSSSAPNSAQVFDCCTWRLLREGAEVLRIAFII
jgi:hypothetical protein